jgi:preprotein translocase subunit YajC
MSEKFGFLKFLGSSIVAAVGVSLLGGPLGDFFGGRFGSFSLSPLLSPLVMTNAAFADAPAVPAGGAGPAAGALAAPAPGMGSMLLPFAAMFAVVYFLMIRPQQKKMKEQTEMLGQLKQGDEVITTSGILGTVRGLTEKVVTLEIADDVKIKILKSQVSQVVKGQIKDLTA